MANVTETYVDASDGSEVSKAETYSVTHKEKNPQKVADYTYQDYRESVERVYSHKDISYIYGYPEKAVRPDGTFKPDQDIARVEVMKLINGMVNRSITTEELEKLGAVNIPTPI